VKKKKTIADIGCKIQWGELFRFRKWHSGKFVLIYAEKRIKETTTKKEKKYMIFLLDWT